MRFIGRDAELNELNTLYKHKDSQLVVIYGRRRVGKSTLIEQFISDKPHLHFEGLEKTHTNDQIKQFTIDLQMQIDDPLLQHSHFREWAPIFNYLTTYFKQHQKKCVFFIDEFQWLAANQTMLVSLIKSYWDRVWKKHNVMLILCGSISSYMVKKVIKSKALYGRINLELCLHPFSLQESFCLLQKKRSKDEVLRYGLLLGGIPKYLNEIDPNKSFDQNINKLCFTQTGILVHEYEKIFYSQFKEHKTYEHIAKLLYQRALTLDQIAQQLNMPSGGGLKSYLTNLENAHFITRYIPYNRKSNSKLIKYRLTDEFLRFYFKYIEPNLQLIEHNTHRQLFKQLVTSQWQSWLGFAFENYCLKNAYHLADIMGFADVVLQWGPYFEKNDNAFQVDLVYVRQDNVITLCEIKYHAKPIDVSIIKDIDQKCQRLKIPKGFTLERALISRFGVDETLATLDYFHHIVTIEDL